MEIAVINQQTRVEWTPHLEAVVTDLMNAVARLHDLEEAAEATVVLVDDQRMQALNRQYRGQDCPTDVLSFAARESLAEEPSYQDPGEDYLLGDIVISLETAVAQSEEYGHGLDREVGFLAVHGMLHLLGYDHQEEEETAVMRATEEKVLAAVGLNRA